MSSTWMKSLTLFLIVLVAAVLFLAIDFALSSSILPEERGAILSREQKPYLERDCGWYELKRDFTGFDSWGRVVYLVTTDHFGFRVNDQRDAATESAASIIVLGDSFAYGLNGKWSNTFVGMLEQSLERRLVNAGVPSYSPTAYLYQYEKALEAGILSRHHTVVVALDISDVQDEATRWESGVPHPIRLLPTSRKSAKSHSLISRIGSRLLFTRRLAGYLGLSAGGTVSEATVYDQPRSAFTWSSWERLDREGYPEGYAPYGVRGGIERVTSRLTQLGELVGQQEAQLYFLIYPWPAQIRYGTARMDWESFVNDLCKDLACAGVINMFPVFREISSRNTSWYKEYFVEGDVHLSTLGNSLVFHEMSKTVH